MVAKAKLQSVPSPRGGPTSSDGGRFLGDDAALVAALNNGHPGAPAELFDRYGGHVQAVLVNVLGVDDELPDLLQETFAQAFAGVGKLRDGNKLKAWLSRIAVFTARGCIRRRTRGRWLRFFAPETLPEARATGASAETREAVAATYRALAGLDADLRIAFALRFIHGMKLNEVAEACEVSLATAKRRLAKAGERFTRLARREPALQSWLREGGRWTID